MARPKLNRINFSCRVDPDTPDTLRRLALALGYVYADRAQVGKLLDDVATGKILLVQRSQHGL
jgi:hypothetical protein